MAYTAQLNPQPLGNVTVTTPGTPVQITKTLQATVVGSGFMCLSTDIVACNKLVLIASPISQAGAGNTGNIYIGSSTMVRATLAGVIAVIPPGGSYSITNNVSMNIYDANKLYVDSDTASDALYGSIDTV